MAVTFTSTWNAAFEATPAGSDQFLVVDNRIRELKDAVQERAAREHFWSPTSNYSLHGLHLEGSARVWYGSSEPTTRPEGETLDTNDAGRIWVPSSASLEVHTGSAWAYLYDLQLQNDLTVGGSILIGTNANIGPAGDADLLNPVSGTLNVNGDVDVTGQVYAAGTLKVGASGSAITQITVT